MSQSAPEHSRPAQASLPTADYSLQFGTVLQLVKEVPPLDYSGLNFPVWERKLFAVARHVCGLTKTYFEPSSPNEVDLKMDHLILCMILWSVDIELQPTIDMDSSAREVFGALKSRFDRCFEPPTDSGQSISYTSKRIQNPVKDPHDSAEALVANTQSPATERNRASLSDLPNEIKEMIVQYVRLLSRSESQDLYEEKFDRVKWDEPGYPMRYGRYELDQTPILTGFQSIAVADRSFSRLCRKALWNRLEFPTLMPTPMTLWTRDILFKHGELVEHLAILLADKWLELNNVNVLPRTELDNLWEMVDAGSDDFETYYARGVSPRNFVKMLSMCPNLQTLNITYPVIQPHHTSEVHILLLHRFLGQNLARFDQLRHLSLTRIYRPSVPSGPSMPDRYVTKIILGLPMLESLTCGYLTRTELASSPPYDKPFEWYLAQLKGLSKLFLEACDCLDRTWSSQSWSKNLTSLTLQWNAKLSTPDLHHLLDSLAPHLTDLKLLINPIFMIEAETGVPGSIAFSSQWAANHQFKLPALTTLILQNTTPWHLLSSFKDCKNLRHLEYIDMPANECKVIQEMVCAITWPKLKVLDLESGKNPEAALIWEHWQSVSKLRKFCLGSGIKFLYDE